MTNFATTPKPIETFLDSVSGAAFPACICELAETRFNAMGLGLNIVRRMPDTDDENYTLGIVPITKTPRAESSEIIGASFTGATLIDHLIVFYAMVKDSERERGAANHSALAEIVEHIVANDGAFRQGLGMLSSTVLGQTKRMQGHSIRATRYLASEIGGNHLFLSATEAVFTVEKVR